MSEQLHLEGMPEPRAALPASTVDPTESVQQLLSDPNASPADLLDAFAGFTSDARLRDALLRHSSLNTADLCMALELWTGTLRHRALSVIADESLLRHWGASPIPQVRCVVAMNPACPADLALRLSEDRHPGVRKNAASAPHLPRHRRSAMANRDPDPGVREYVHWLLTTRDGREIVHGSRYTAPPGPDDPDTNAVGRIVSYGVDAHQQAPV